MKTYPGIDYDFRPVTYWSAADPLSLILRHVKGSNRRQMIRDYWEAGALKELDDVLLEDTLSDEKRQRLGAIHPSFMGGEYLPDFLPGEEEIVRIQLASTTSDVISVRARPVPGGIAWRAVDEYDVVYILPHQFTHEPPTLAELIHLLEETTDGGLDGGLILGFNNNCLEVIDFGIYELRDFTTIESEQYPQLWNHCECVFEEWVAEHTEYEDEDYDEEEEAESETDSPRDTPTRT